MARKKTSPAEDLMELVAMFPWWVGVALALVSYIVLHAIAAPRPAGLSQNLMVALLASVGQWIVPILCLFGALGSYLGRRRREGLVGGVAQSKGPEALHGTTWREFELLVGEAFRLQGYKVTETGGSQPDGGVDLVLRKGTETFLVQCKQWKARKVTVNVVRELYGVMAAQEAAGGFVITSGSFTDDARAFAEGRNVGLVDGPKLFGLIQQARTSLSTASSFTAATKAAPPASTSTPMMEAPACPICKSSMLRRTARKGVNAGSQFWGCSQYPVCRGTR